MRSSVLYLIAGLILLLGCSGIDRDVQTVLEGGDDLEQARMELLFAKGEALDVLLAAVADTTHAGPGRARLVDVLWKLHLRESDSRIVPALSRLVRDGSTAVRIEVAESLTNMNDASVLAQLIEQVAVETDDEARHQQFKAIEALDNWTMDIVNDAGVFRASGGDRLTDDQRRTLMQAARSAQATATKDSLRTLATEFLAKMAAQVTERGDRAILAADIDGAEALYRAALEIRPESEITLQRLGQLYLFNGQQERGLQVLFDAGIAVRVPRLAGTPVLDGDLSDPEWKAAAYIEDFHKTIRQFRVEPASGRTEAWLAYTDTSVWVAVKGYEEDTSTLTANEDADDSNVWRDDCVEIFFDADLDRHDFHQFVVNSLGIVGDYYFGGQSWDGEFSSQQRAAAVVEPTFWSVEFEVPLRSIDATSIKPGDIWGFNVARVRISHSGEHNIWTPTYGLSGRVDRFGVAVFD